MPVSAILQYYAAPGPMTDPGEHTYLFADLPADLHELCKIVQGCLLHIFWAERNGVKLSEERKQEVQIRPVAAKLPRLLDLDSHPLNISRPPERRLVGNCRDFSVLLVSMLRYLGIPARARCGFGAYFMPNHYEDHWVVEYWNAKEQRWILVDAQLDELQRSVLQPPFDPLDVPRNQFIVAGQAWQLCRAGLADPDAFGIFDMHGTWFIGGNVVRDFLSFNKVEILPWDSGWGFLTMDALNPASVYFEGDKLDRVSQWTLNGDECFNAIRDEYSSEPRWQAPFIESIETGN
ncbi:MAG: transglutaminase-like domain-containing protein [Omnitrophica WOR_2 bacterium]